MWELNEAIRPLLEDLNQRPFQKLPGSRLSHFNELEKSVLKPLPARRYDYAEWKKVRVGFNYHVEVEKHFYSIPFTLAKKEVHIRYNTKTIEVFYQSTRVASHVRSYAEYGYTTDTVHMPKNHQAQTEWTPERVTSWARKSGNAVGQLVEIIMRLSRHPQQAFRPCVGIIRLGKSYGNARLDAACKRALHIGAHSYKSVESILKNNLDQTPLPPEPVQDSEKNIPESHEYIRGKDYFR